MPSSTLLSWPRRLNGWKSWLSFSGGSPGPVSLTLMRVRPALLVEQSRTTFPPGWLYLIALERRLMSTCFKRMRSEKTKRGESNWGKVKVRFRFCPRWSIIAWHSSSTSDSETGSTDSESFPDSITARSRISLISSSRYHPAWRIWSMLAFCEAVAGGVSESISCAKPRMALSGERSSWLILERNSDLARLAFSATKVALSSSAFLPCSTSSRRLRSVTSRAAAKTPCRFRFRS